MKYRTILPYALALLALTNLAASETTSRPLSFEENLGQFGPAARTAYFSRAAGYRMEFGPAGVSFLFPDGARIAMDLGSQAHWAAPVVAKPLVMRSNYLLSKDPGNWVTGARHFQQITYRQIYPGIDLQFTPNGHSIEYDFLVAPGADPAKIALRFTGANSLTTTPNGDLLMKVGANEMRHRKPVVYQESASGRTTIPASIRLKGDRVQFSLAAFRRDRTLVIDPVVEASTLLGGGGEDRLLAVAADSAGNMYVAGLTDSAPPIPLPTTPGAKQATYGGGQDAFVAKIAADGKTFLYVTYLGGAGDDSAEAIAVDPAGNAVITGSTRSATFPTTSGAAQSQFSDLRSTNPEPDAFVVKLNDTGTAILFSTFLGKSSTDRGRAVALDPNGNVYVTGETRSPDFVTTAGAYQRTLRGPTDAFVVKLNPSGTAILFSTLYGTAGDDHGAAIAVDSSGAVIFAGDYGASDLPKVGNAFQTSPPGGPIFLAKLNAAGSALVFSNSLGSSAVTFLGNVALDGADNIYVSGTASGSDFPVTLPAPGPAGIGGPFVTKIGPNGGPFLYSRIVSCGVICNGNAVAVEPGGRAYLVGYVLDDRLETSKDALMPIRQFNAMAAFVTRLETTGEILDSTYWYGSGNPPSPFGVPSHNATTTIGKSIALVSPGVVVLGGTTTALRFPVTTGAAQTTIRGTSTWDSFVTRISYTSTCTYSLSTELITAPAAGSSTVVNVTAAPGCPWFATPSDEWVDVQVLNASQIRVSVPPSSMVSRDAAVFVGGKTIIVQQGSGCTYSVRNKAVAVPANGGFVQVDVDTGFACPWTPTADVPWIPGYFSNKSPSSGSGPLGVSVLVNQYPVARTGFLTIAPGVAVTFQQPAATCTYTVDPLTVTVSAPQQIPTVAVTTQPGCNWLKEEAPPWMDVATMVGNEGTGSGAARLFFYPNDGPVRTGTVKVAGQLVTVTQKAPPIGHAPDAFPTGVFSYTANPQSFGFGGRDLDGLANLDRIYFLVHTASTPAAGTCYGYLDVTQRAIYLYDNAATTASGPLTSGQAATLQNSQCSINGAGFSNVGTNSSDIYLNLTITRLGSFATGAKTLYLLAVDKDGNDNGWQFSGNWNPVGAAPAPPTVLPASSLYVQAQFTHTITARDGNGFADLRRVYFLLSPSTTISGATCHGYYDRIANEFALYNDSLSGLIGPLAAGAGTIQNSQCSITSSGANTVRGAGSDLAIDLTFTVLGNYGAATKKLYALAQDSLGADSGWIDQATLTIPGAGPNQPPTVLSVNPANPTGSPQTFIVTGRDPNGYADIDRVYFLINADTNLPTLTCHGFYDKTTRSFYLYDDGLTRLLGPLQAGFTGTLTNSQCTLDGSLSTTPTVSGTDFTVKIGLKLNGSFAATPKNIYWWLQDTGALGTGWVQTGTWTPAPGVANLPPTVIVGTPLALTGSPQTVPLTGRDPNGYPNIERVYFLVNANSAIPANTCHGFWDRATNALYLYSDGLASLQGPLTPGASATLSNSQCTINGATSAPVTGNGNDLTVTLGLGLNGSFATAAKNIYAWVQDTENNGTGWVQTGVWSPSAVVPNQPPTILSASPATPAGSPQTFTVVARDPNGFANLQRLYFLVNSNTSIPANTCHGFYDRALNAFYLYNDELTALLGPLAPGAAGTLTNSQCTIHGVTSTPVNGAGTDLTVNLAMSLNGAFATAAKNVYFWAHDNDNNGTGWVQKATWTPPASGVSSIPALISSAPANPVAGAQTFTFTARDGNGFTNIQRLYFLVNTSTAIPAGTCHGFYDRAANALFLYNDGLTALLGPLSPGASGTLSNSQCTIRGADSIPVSGSGTDFTVTLGLTLKAPYSSTTRNVYAWVQDLDGNGTGWVQTSVWNPSAANAAPSVLAPSALTVLSTTPQSVQFASRDNNGFADINRVYFVVSTNQAQVTTNGCHGFYDRAANAFYLYDDTLTSLQGPLAPGQAATIQNTQCAIQGAGTSILTAAGSDLTVAVQMNLRGAFATTPKKLYILTQDAANADSGWQQN